MILFLFRSYRHRPAEDQPFSVDCPEVTQLHGRDALMSEAWDFVSSYSFQRVLDDFG